MVAAELVMVDGGVARPGEGAADLGSADAMGRLEAQFLATELVLSVCEDADREDTGTSVAGTLVAVLGRAVAQEPFPLEDIVSLTSNVEEDLGEEELGPDAAEQLRSLGEALLAEVRELEALGLVDTSDGMVAVPVAALDAVYDALYGEGGALDEDEDYGDEGFDDEDDEE